MTNNILIKAIGLASVFILIAQASWAQKKYSIDNYIDEHAEFAQELMEETGVPASVILGVAIHESAFGNSKIARFLHNHFGIKGKNNSTKIKSAYKGYSSVKDSYKDFVGLLQRRKATLPLFEKHSNTEYEAWIKGIAASGYASNIREWPVKVLSLINKYELDRYDAVLDDLFEEESGEDLVDTYIFPQFKNDFFPFISPFYYTVQINDSLEEIAELFGTSVEELERRNQIDAENIHIGLGLIIG